MLSIYSISTFNLLRALPGYAFHPLFTQFANPIPPGAETKELKRRVRDIIDPGRNLGHVDSHNKPAVTPAAGEGDEGVVKVAGGEGAFVCKPGEDCG